MSRSEKPRHGTRTKLWKDTVGKSHSQAKSRSALKKITSRSARRKDDYAVKEEVRVRTGKGDEFLPKERKS